MRPKRTLTPLIALPALLAVLLATSGCGGNSEQSSTGRLDTKALAGSPPSLAKLHGQANRLLGGGKRAFEKRLRSLRGHPIVINKWASWCGPCRREFPFFRDQSLEHGKTIAFLGINSSDDDGDARDFLASNPVSYPSYIDSDQEIAELMDARQAFPATVFVSSRGKLVRVHPGQYASEKDLEQDIQRYAK